MGQGTKNEQESAREPSVPWKKRAKLNTLFDIAKCNCYRKCQSFQDTHFVACSCPHEDKIPELSFHIDQVTLRKQYIAGVDMSTTRTLCEREMRRSAKKKNKGNDNKEKNLI